MVKAWTDESDPKELRKALDYALQLGVSAADAAMKAGEERYVSERVYPRRVSAQRNKRAKRLIDFNHLFAVFFFLRLSFSFFSFPMVCVPFIG